MASIQYTVNTVSDMARVFNESAMATEDLINRLNALSRQVADPSVDLQDADANLKILQMAKKIEQLSAKVADPEIDVKGARAAQLQIARLEAQLDRLSHKHVTVDVDVDVNRRGLRGLLSSLGGEGGLGGAFSGGLGSPGGIGALIGGGAVAASLVPSLLALLVGGGVGLAGAGSAFTLGRSAEQKIQQIEKRLATATGAARRTDLRRLAELRQQNAPELQVARAVRDLERSAIGTLGGALSAGGGNSFASGVASIVRELGPFLKSIGPELGAMLRASLPFLEAFVRVLEQAAKAVLPAFTQLMTQLAASGALKELTGGFIAIAQGVATFAKNLGPGLKPSADIFAHLARIVGDVLGFLGSAFAQIARWLDPSTSPINKAMKAGVAAMTASWHVFWHNLFDSFDQARHFIAASWDATWRDTKKIVASLVSGVLASFRAFWHDVASIFSTIRGGIASAWNTIWTNTKNAVTTGISAVVNFFKGLPGKAINALWGFGHSLAAFARSAFTEMWNAIKNVGGSIWDWLTSWVHRLPGWLRKLLGISSPSSVFYDIGKNMMLGLFHGIKDHAHHAANAARSSIGGIGDTGARSASAAVAQSFALSVLPRGWSWPALLSLWNQESSWSAYAINKSSGAYGIPQALPAVWGHPYALGDYKAQIMWGIRYIASRYGNSQAAWGHEQAFNWYGSGGWINEPVIGVGMRSGQGYGFGERGPEYVGHGGGTVINIHVSVPPTVNPAQAGQQIAQLLLQHTKKGGRLYPQGVTPR